jgi:hypothetical protein
MTFHSIEKETAKRSISCLGLLQAIWKVHVLWRKSWCQTPKSRTVFDPSAAERGHSEAPEDQAEGI